MPEPGSNQILVKVAAVALNTVNVMNVDHPLALQDRRVVGTDSAGVVERIGKDLKGVSYAIGAVPTVAKVESTLSPSGRFTAYRTPSIGGFDMATLKIKPVVGPVGEGLGVEIG